MKIPRPNAETALRVASVLAIVGLALMVWGVLDPRALPVLAGLTVGQAIGTLSFVIYLVVVATDLAIKKKMR